MDGLLYIVGEGRRRGKELRENARVIIQLKLKASRLASRQEDKQSNEWDGGRK
jgi:hypothetical protein